MTTRNLTSAMASAITAGKVRPVIFVEGSFGAAGSPDEEFLRLWSGNGNFDWDGKTWGGAGQLLRLSPIEETAEVKAVGFSVELSGLPQSTLALALDNTRQGRPGRVWLGLMGREGYLSLPGETADYASTSDSPVLGVTGDIDIRVGASLDDVTPAIAGNFIAKRQSSFVCEYQFGVNTTGALFFVWFPTGAAASQIVVGSTALPNNVAGQRMDYRVTMDVDVGGSPSQYAVRFYTSVDNGENWTQLGNAVTGAGSTTIFDGGSPLEIGSVLIGSTQLMQGKIYYASVRNGIDGTVVASFDPSTDAQQGSKSFTSSATGETWTINQSGSTRAEIVVNENHLIADPYLTRAGRMDYVSISSDGQGTTITAQYEDRLIDLERSRERRYTDEDQQFQYSGDGGFRFVAGLQDKQLIWGGPGAASSPLAAPRADTAVADSPVEYHRGARTGDD